MARTITFCGSTVEAEILAPTAGFVARFIRYAERMEALGPDLGMPCSRTMAYGLFERHVKAAEGIARVADFVAQANEQVLARLAAEVLMPPGAA